MSFAKDQEDSINEYKDVSLKLKGSSLCNFCLFVKVRLTTKCNIKVHLLTHYSHCCLSVGMRSPLQCFPSTKSRDHELSETLSQESPPLSRSPLSPTSEYPSVAIVVPLLKTEVWGFHIGLQYYYISGGIRAKKRLIAEHQNQLSIVNSVVCHQAAS